MTMPGRPLRKNERLLANIPFDDAGMRAFLGIERWEGPPELSFYDQTLFRPTFNINGLHAGNVGAVALHGDSASGHGGD